MASSLASMFKLRKRQGSDVLGASDGEAQAVLGSNINIREDGGAMDTKQLYIHFSPYARTI